MGLWVIWPKIKHHYLRPGPRVAEKKNLGQNDPVASSYGGWSETNFGRKVHFFNCGPYGIWRYTNTALMYIAGPRPNRSCTAAL